MKLRFFAILPILFLGACAPTAMEIANADYGPYPNDYESIVKSYVGNQLKDPYSAIFELRAPSQGWNGMQKKFGWVVCGTVNGKNSYGGYTGADPIWVLINRGVVTSYFTGNLAKGACENIH